VSARELARAGACDAGSMRKVAADLDVSPALVSLAIRNKHHAGLEYIRARVEARLGGVECPVLGAISTQQCRANRNRQFSSINPLAVRLYRACHGGCPHNQTP
jgi:hypothetical protein